MTSRRSNERGGSVRRNSGSEGRGQLLLAGAFVLAVALIGLTLVLNAGNYSATLATKSGPVASGGEAIAVRERVERDLTKQFRYVIQQEDTRSTRKSEFTSVVAPVASGTRGYLGARGRSIAITTDGFIHGTKVANGNVGGTGDPFTADGMPGGTADWNLAEDVELRNATFIVTDVSVAAGTANPDLTTLQPFTIYVGDESDLANSWRISVYAGDYDGDSDDEWVVETHSPDDNERRCVRNAPGTVDGPSGDGLELNITNARFGAASFCGALDAVEPATDTYDVRVVHGDGAEGRYWAIVDKPIGPAGSDATSSFQEQTLYAAEVSFEYHTATVEYETTLEIAPNELS